MTDRFANMGDDLLSPASHAATVSPSDTVDLPFASKRLWVGTLGDVKVTTVGGDTVTYPAVPAGTYLLVRAARVFAAGTTATVIVAEY